MKRQLADPYGVRALARAEATERKVHYAGVDCWLAVRTFTWNRHVTSLQSEVTCRMCLYYMKRYMPLSRLREHQTYNRMRATAAESTDASG